MKTNKLICKALSLVALLCMGQTAAWAQAVTGKRYNLTEYETNILSSVSAVLTDGTNVGNSYQNGISNVFDNNDGTYWKSTLLGNVNIDFTFRSAQTIDRIEIMQGGNTQERSNYITVYSSNGDRWSEVQRFELDRNDQTVFLYLSQTLTTRYLRLQLHPDRISGDNDAYRAAINEIDFSYASEQPLGTIQHKDPKWIDLKTQLNHSDQAVGTFDFDQPRFDPIMSSSTEGIQASHTYIDTLYVHKGSLIELSVPTKMKNEWNSTSSTQTYQRWYSYRTDATFETETHSGAYDLLTPKDDGNYYRFSNGYVGYPLGARFSGADFYYPTNDEFNEMFPSAVGNPNIDNDWYVVACDISSYTDFTETFTSKGNTETNRTNLANEFRTNGYYEPTLSVRAIYYIVGVDERDNGTSTSKEENWKGGHGRLTDEKYQGGNLDNLNDVDEYGNPEKRYLEEYDITFPSKHISNHTNELVALSKDPRGYAIPDVRETANLDIHMTSYDPTTQQSNVLKLMDTSLSGVDRIIQFRANDSNNQGTWEVNDGTTATIIVTKTAGDTTYNIARFNLTFLDQSIPFTQTQISQIKLSEEDTPMDERDPNEYRKPEWMAGNLNKLTELTFDFDPATAASYGQNDHFPYPLSWGTSSYAFFDGSPLGDFIGVSKYDNNRWYAEWDYYAIANDYVGFDDVNTITARPEEGKGKPLSDYHVYVDASDRPGVLARLPFDEKLCPGSELFVTAWMKSAGATGSDDAAIMFTVMGVTNNADGSQTYTPIYRHSSSQIRTTCWLNNGIPGTGSNTNEWFQIYFSFINNDEDAKNYDSYILQLENNCASSTGGDYYYDDIKVYIAQPSASVKQKEFTCTNERTRMNIELDWERLLSRLGGEGTNVDNGIDFIFIDETVYNTTYAQRIAAGDSEEAAKLAGINAALREVGDGEVYNQTLVTLYFNNTFDSNKQYGGEGNEFALDNMVDGKAYFYRDGSDQNGNRVLTVDFYSVLSPNRPYLMLIQPHFADSDPEAQDFVQYIGDACAIQSRFYVESEALIKINGEVIDPSTDFCAGQVFNFSAQMRVPTGVDAEGNETFELLEDDVYFDWFFGSETDFNAANPDYGGVSLQSALVSFRAAYPYATEISMEATPCSNEEITNVYGEKVIFSENEFNIIKHYVDAPTGDEGGINNQLVLYRENLDIALLESGLELVVYPVPTLLPPDGSSIGEEQWRHICWNYIPIVLGVDGDAPQLFAGFNNVQYPAPDFNPSVRIGLSQIRAAQTEPLRVSLRGAKIVTAEADNLGTISNLNKLYLVGTDDPAYANLVSAEDFDRHSLPVGTIEELFAETYEQGSSYNDHMNITFNLAEQEGGFKFDPREGYTYTFEVNFEEKGDGEVYNTCYGSFPLDVKVVPEYLVWQGGANDNWNSDANWKRATRDDIKAATGDTYADYPEADLNAHGNGFVPMLFSNVVMPKDSKVELYMAGYREGGGVASWESSNQRPENIGDPTENIQYDLMAYDDDPDEGIYELTTQRYRVNICRDIHFEPGAEMLHAEQLIYNKAWMDVSVPTKQWTLVSTPLSGVVAGDWYTTSATGTQENLPYFKDITFSDQVNDRLNPAVYQRSWSQDATVYEADNTSATVGFTTSTPTWSAAYNDAAVPYPAGAGFSVKTAAVNSGATLSFRLPKADTQYTVAGNRQTISRADNGRMLISGLLDRGNPLQLVRHDDVTQTLTQSQGGKYMIVGNPYMAQLDLKKFFAANTNLTGSYWSETADGPENGLMTTTGEWLAPGTGTIAPFGSFFVQLAEGSTDTKVKFTADMQKFETTAAGGAETQAFTITADDGKAKSGAVLAYADNAENAFNAAEDARLMRNLLGNNANELSVYTIAGDKAASVNQVKDLQQIPLGLFAADGDVTTLTFTGTDALLEPSLYDAELNTDTPITEGMTLSVSGASHGRYFIRARGAGEGTSGISEVVGDADGDVTVYSVAERQVVVSSSAGLRAVRVYAVGGQLLKSESVADDRTAVTLDGVDSGVAIVRVTTAAGTTVKKITVK